MPALRAVRIAVLIPAGPRDDVLDTLASVVHYTDSSRVIVVIDDSGKLMGNDRVARISPDIAVLPAVAARSGPRGGLWVKLGAGYRWILEHYQPGMILRLDADALFIGQGLEAAAERVFASDPSIGLLGSYRVGPDGRDRDFSWVRHQLRVEAGARGLLQPRRRACLRHYWALARSHGYTDGEHTLGAACIHSYPAARAIYENGWFGDPRLESSFLGDDHLLGLVTVAAGFRLADLGGPEGPMALRWQGLPADPAELLAAGKAITHSVRSWQHLTEPEIRAFFAKSRATSQSAG